jgi:hypothetical protein
MLASGGPSLVGHKMLYASVHITNTIGNNLSRRGMMDLGCHTYFS